MNKKRTRTTLLLLFFTMWLPSLSAQCEIVNTAFQNGEEIQYDLYFNLGILNARAGRGSLSVTDANYRGENAYKMVMLLNTSGLAGTFYTVLDTLTSYIDKDLRPLLFTKEAQEGKDYSVERQSYTYSGNEISIRAIRHWNGEESFDEVVTTDQCTYDYLSVLAFVRNLDLTGMQYGDRKYIQFISGKRAVNMYVNYLGTSTIKANNGQKYEVVNISMTIHDDAFTNQKEALKASLTNDANRLPVVIDTSLKLGSVRAVLSDVTGLRN
ncbi:MAG: DUF3108 domain-containing protein [Bacteroidales bacterium]|nr:DUF3108 domain-containing protein [Bacteroidales bacterium]